MGNKKNKITVAVPVLNESRTISKIVKFALRDRLVGEVLVVDDGSIDGTPELARAAGARVITSSMLGKGASMEDALQAARYDILLYLDGDLSGLRRDLISKMTEPLLSGEADFVKAKFTRAAGRVTILTARPLLRMYFPELQDVSQPLGGIIAARRSLLRNLRFENDYGVDVGLLIDALGRRAPMVQVEIGELHHQSQTLEKLGDMAAQVARTILERAAEWGRLRVNSLRAARERDRVRQSDLRNSLHMLKGASKIALFDMDGTLLNGRFVFELAARTERLEKLSPLVDNASLNATQRTRRIAKVFSGVPRRTFHETAREIPLMPGAIETVVGLRKLGYLVGIVTDSYYIAAEIVRRRVFADFAIAHVLRFRGDRATGGLTIAPSMLHPRACKKHALCKLNVLHHLAAEAGVSPDKVVAVGDSNNDVCMLKEANFSVAFNPKSLLVKKAAHHVLRKDLRGVLTLLGERSPSEPELRNPPSVEPE